MLATSQKIKHRLNALLNKDDIIYSIKNVRINGQPHGCSGFIYYKPTKVTVYVSTDFDGFRDNTACLVRYALNDKDYRGFQNQYTSDENIGIYIKSMLLNANAYQKAIQGHRW